jgi:hypothetical protein
MGSRQKSHCGTEKKRTSKYISGEGDGILVFGEVFKEGKLDF